MSEESNKEDMRPGGMPWRELFTNDKAASIQFYTELFGWTIGEMEMPGGESYTMFNLDDKPIAGLVEAPEGVDAPPMWLNYVTVADLDASIAKAVALGGTILKERVDIPMGSFAVFSGKEGAVCAFWQYAEGADSDC